MAQVLTGDRTQDSGLSSLRIHKLHLHAGRHPTPVAPFGLHLVLNGANLK